MFVSRALSRIIDGFEGLEVPVIGEAMLDSYLEGTTGRLCREALAALQEAEIVFGGERHIALVGSVPGELRPWPQPFRKASSATTTANRPPNVQISRSGAMSKGP